MPRFAAFLRAGESGASKMEGDIQDEPIAPAPGLSLLELDFICHFGALKFFHLWLVQVL